MQLLRSYFADPQDDLESYRRTGLYGVGAVRREADIILDERFVTSTGDDEWKDGAFRVDPYWFAANPGPVGDLATRSIGS